MSSGRLRSIAQCRHAVVGAVGITSPMAVGWVVAEKGVTEAAGREVVVRGAAGRAAAARAGGWEEAA